jgi:hypothetical protein
VARAREQVSFIEDWLRAYQQLASPEMQAEARQRALTDLHRAYAVVDQTLAAVQTPKQPVNVRHVLSRLLLLQPLRTKTAKILRIVFYLSLAWLLLWVSAAVLFGAGIAASSTDSLLADAFVGLGIFVLCLAIGVAPALPLYWLVLASDRAGSAVVSFAVDTDGSDGTAQRPASS